MKRRREFSEPEAPLPEETQGRTPRQVETTMQILEWLLFGVVFAGFVALMWKLGTLTWNFFKLII